MANNRLSMRKITEALRLYHECGRSHREIATAIGSSPTTVGNYLRRAKFAGITYPLPEGITDDEIDARLGIDVLPDAAKTKSKQAVKRIKVKRQATGRMDIIFPQAFFVKFG